jgi:hypothetical protein
MKRADLSSALMPKLVSIARVALLSVAVTGCATQTLETARRVKGTPEPNRWKEFLERAEEGKLEEVRDEIAGPSTDIYWIDYQFGQIRTVAHRPAASGSEVFKGKFRPEAKTSYARVRKEKVTDVESLLNGLPTDAQMTKKHHELVAKDSKHQNHLSRIPEEKRNVSFMRGYIGWGIRATTITTSFWEIHRN